MNCDHAHNRKRLRFGEPLRRFAPNVVMVQATKSRKGDQVRVTAGFASRAPNPLGALAATPARVVDVVAAGGMAGFLQKVAVRTPRVTVADDEGECRSNCLRCLRSAH